MNLAPVACNGKPSERKRCRETPSYTEPKSDRRKKYEEEKATKQENHEANTFVWQGQYLVTSGSVTCSGRCSFDF